MAPQPGKALGINFPLQKFIKLRDLFCFGPPSLVSINFLLPPDARAIFLHSNVLYNNIECVTGGHKKTLGGGGG